MYLRFTRGRFDPTRADEVMQFVPDIVAAIRRLPGCVDFRGGVDGAAGRTLSVTTFDTLEHAQFSRDQLGEAFVALQALGWQVEAPEIYEMIQ